MAEKRKSNDLEGLAKAARQKSHGMRVAFELSPGAGQEAFEYVRGHPPSIPGTFLPLTVTLALIKYLMFSELIALVALC